MQFRQNGPRDDRRRRVLRDELMTSPSDQDNSATGTGDQSLDKAPARGYSAAVAIESQPPISCLIATRPWTLTVLVLAGFSVIAGLEAAYANIFHGLGLRPELIAALNVTAPGSLAAWFSTVLLTMASVNAVLVYWLRSHKLDDYRARYRVWLWAAMGLILAAINASTSLHSVVGHLIADRFDSPWLQNSGLNAVTVMSFVFGALAVRVGFEIWPSRLARSWAVVASLGYLAAILVQVPALAIESPMLAAMAQSASILIANLAVGLTVASYCRYVHLESQGALKPRRQRAAKQVGDAGSDDTADDAEQSATPEHSPTPRSEKVKTQRPVEVGATKKTLRTKTVNSKAIRCDAAHQSPAEARSKTSEKAAAVENLESPDNEADQAMLDFDPETGERLSKSERRRLRKQMRRQKKAGTA